MYGRPGNGLVFDNFIAFLSIVERVTCSW